MAMTDRIKLLGELIRLTEENEKLKEENINLRKNIKTGNISLLKCITLKSGHAELDYKGMFEQKELLFRKSEKRYFELLCYYIELCNDLDCDEETRKKYKDRAWTINK